MSPTTKPTDPVPDNNLFSFVDVRDVAEAHLRAYDVPEASNQRFFVSKGYFQYQQFVDALREHIPEIRDRVPVGNPKTGVVHSDVYNVNVSKSEKVLGLKYHSLEETIADGARSLLELENKNA
jgi:nucleoside-diphosphate-sugar epimerase